MNNTKDILEKEKREATIKDGIDPVRVGWNSAIDHLIPIVEKLVERAKTQHINSGYYLAIKHALEALGTSMDKQEVVDYLKRVQARNPK